MDVFFKDNLDIDIRVCIWLVILAYVREKI